MARVSLLARIALLGLLASGGVAAAGGIAPSWSRHCTLPASSVSNDTDRSQVQALVERCTAHDACTLACRASTCADRVEESCEADCRRAQAASMGLLADRWADRKCEGRSTWEDRWIHSDELDAALAAGLGDLAKIDVPAGEVEVRIWASTYASPWQPMLRLRRSARGTIAGDLYIHYPLDLAMDGNKDGLYTRRFMRANCRTLALGAERATCHARFEREPRWDASYRRLVKLGLLTLPDQDDLPEPPPGPACVNADSTNTDEPCELEHVVVFHAPLLRVEVRQGQDYRRYAYHTGYSRGRPEDLAAGEILHVVQRLLWRIDER